MKPSLLLLFWTVLILMKIGDNRALCDYLEERKVVYIDKSAQKSGFTTYLFRGNEPKIKVNGVDTFAYDLLRKYLANATVTQAGFQLPSSYYLIDIKFVYDTIDPAESNDIIMETDFFNSNPTLGEFYTHTILGDLLAPSSYNKSQLIKLVPSLSQWQHDDLPGYIYALHQLLNFQRDQNTVIYLHCECGCDRTGEISGSYALSYLNKTFADVIKWNDGIAGRSILPNHQSALDWYCMYLSMVEGKDLGPCNGS